jgi:hypothetical protein
LRQLLSRQLDRSLVACSVAWLAEAKRALRFNTDRQKGAAHGPV